MTHERYPGDDPREWIKRARSNLTQARAEHPDVYLEDLCFQAQQAAEKALKGLILHYGKSFPYTHDISLLISVLDAHKPTPQSLHDAALLTQYAVATRYPGIIEPVTKDEYVEAVRLAAEVVAWATGIVSPE